MRRLAGFALLALASCNSSPDIAGEWSRVEWDKGLGWEEASESNLHFRKSGILRHHGVRSTGKEYDTLNKFFVHTGVLYRCPEDAQTCTAETASYAARIEFVNENEMILRDGIKVQAGSEISHRYKRN